MRISYICAFKSSLLAESKDKHLRRAAERGNVLVVEPVEDVTFVDNVSANFADVFNHQACTTRDQHNAVAGVSQQARAKRWQKITIAPVATCVTKYGVLYSIDQRADHTPHRFRQVIAIERSFSRRAARHVFSNHRSWSGVRAVVGGEMGCILASWHPCGGMGRRGTLRYPDEHAVAPRTGGGGMNSSLVLSDGYSHVGRASWISREEEGHC